MSLWFLREAWCIWRDNLRLFFYDTCKISNGVMLHLSLGFGAWMIDSLASSPYMYRVGLFRRDLDYFLKVLFRVKLCYVLQAVMSPSFFIRWGKETKCVMTSTALLMFWSFFYQGVSVLAMSSSRNLSSYDEAQLWGWTGNDLSSSWSVCLTFDQSRLGRSLDLTPFSFLVGSM